MRTPIVSLSLALAAALSGPALAANPAGHDHGAPAGDCCKTPATYEAKGVVKRVDAASGKVTVAHEAIPALGWPKMTMSFGVLNDKLLAGLKPDRKVAFRFEKIGSDYVIVAVQGIEAAGG